MGYFDGKADPTSTTFQDRLDDSFLTRLPAHQAAENGRGYRSSGLGPRIRRTRRSRENIGEPRQHAEEYCDDTVSLGGDEDDLGVVYAYQSRSYQEKSKPSDISRHHNRDHYRESSYSSVRQSSQSYLSPHARLTSTRMHSRPSGNVPATYFTLFSRYPALFSVICHSVIQVPKLYNLEGSKWRGAVRNKIK